MKIRQHQRWYQGRGQAGGEGEGDPDLASGQQHLGGRGRRRGRLCRIGLGGRKPRAVVGRGRRRGRGGQVGVAPILSL